jgi:ankyrin repeat protein
MLHKVQYYDSAKYMLDNGLKKYINTTNNDNEYPIEHLFSITTTDTNIIKLFIDNGAKVDIIDNDGNTFLHKLNLWYSRDDLELKNIFELAKILLKHHIDINHKNKKGKTVLDEVIDFIDTKPERAKTIAFLINNGATYTELHLNAIDKYFKACNSGNLEKVSNIVESNSYKHMLSEIKGMCKTGDNQCISKTLTDEYGAKEYAVLKYNKQYDSAYIFINDDKPKIIKLYLTADKKISFGEK